MDLSESSYSGVEIETSAAMGAELYLISLTAAISALSLLVLWRLGSLTTMRAVLLLFIVDIVMTLEAAVYSDIVLIAVLHVITIPALFGLIYLDLFNQHRSYTQCFICSGKVKNEDALTVKRNIRGQPLEILAHKKCVSLESDERKALSNNQLKKGASK
jgi:hypothetical protein